MSYTPTIWANGKAPALNAENLNKIEEELVKLEGDVEGLVEADKTINEALQTVQGDVDNLKQSDTTLNQNLQKVNSDIAELKEADHAINETLQTVQSDVADLKEGVTISTTSTTMPNSHEGRLLIEEIGGVCEQGENPSPTSPQEIKKSVVSGVKTHGKNFLNIEEVNKNTNGFAIGVNNNVITVKGTAEKDTLLYAMGGYATEEVLFTLGIGTYSLSDGLRLINNTDNRKNYKGTFTLTEPFKVTTLQIMNPNNGSGTFNAGDLFDFSINAMLNEGDKLLEFEPYKESSIALSQPINLYSISDVQDVINDGKVNRKFEKYELTGAENISEADSYFSIPLIKEAINGSALCDIDSLARNTKNYARLQKYGMTLDDFKAYLVERYESGNPAYFIYRIAEEVTEELPLTDQIALNSLATYDGITYLEFDSEVEPTFEGKHGAKKVGVLQFGSNWSGSAMYGISGKTATLTLEATPISVNNNDTIISGLPTPLIDCYLSLATANGSYSAKIEQSTGRLIVHQSGYTNAEKASCTITYVCE